MTLIKWATFKRYDSLRRFGSPFFVFFFDDDFYTLLELPAEGFTLLLDAIKEAVSDLPLLHTISSSFCETTGVLIIYITVPSGFEA